ncbi:MAG: enoyl-CoA hydratase [Burkholderiales bacterium]|nr:enoyl-CoA hydratase [Burkholderiales bacterium]
MNEIVIRREDALLRIQLNRPAKKNALTAGMYAAIAEALRRANADAGVRVVLIHGVPEAFTAGNDLQDFLANPPTGDAAPVKEFLQALAHVEKPFVAAVTGAAVGVGTTMLLHCDLVYAAEDARFALPFVNLGLCPEAASSFLLPAIAGYQRAAELLLLGEPFDAARAREAGIVNEVLAPDLVLTAAEQAAHKLAAKPPAAVRVTKRLLKAQMRAMTDAALAEELREFLERLVSPEAKEAFAAFLEKRKPDFSKFS